MQTSENVVSSDKMAKLFMYGAVDRVKTPSEVSRPTNSIILLLFHPVILFVPTVHVIRIIPRQPSPVH
jgi:hypothetical protein